MSEEKVLTFGHQYAPEEGGEPDDARKYTAYVSGDDDLLRVYYTEDGKRLLELLPDEAVTLARFILHMYREETTNE